MLRCTPELVTTTTEDATNPFVTTVIIDGIVVARGAYSSKKASKQVRLRST